jgi:hypothetical protein
MKISMESAIPIGHCVIVSEKCPYMISIAFAVSVQKIEH